MSTLFKALLVVSQLLLVGSGVAAEQAALLIEIERSKADRIAQYNGVFFDEQAYFARRHRIVEIDEAQLIEQKAVMVTLFPDLPQVQLHREILRTHPDRGTATWQGTWSLPGQSLSGVRIQQDTLGELGLREQDLKEALFGVRLFMVRWDMERDSKRAYLSRDRVRGLVAPEPISVPLLPDIEEDAFYSVRGTLDLSVLGYGKYRIRPLRYSPRYHVVYELDETKTFVETDPRDDSPYAR